MAYIVQLQLRDSRKEFNTEQEAENIIKQKEGG